MFLCRDLVTYFGFDCINQLLILNSGYIYFYFYNIAEKKHPKRVTMKILTSNSINVNYWFDYVDPYIKHLYEEMRSFFSGKNIRRNTFDLLAIKLKKVRINLLPMSCFILFIFFLFFSRTVGKCQICTRFFAFDGISSYLSEL